MIDIQGTKLGDLLVRLHNIFDVQNAQIGAQAGRFKCVATVSKLVLNTIITFPSYQCLNCILYGCHKGFEGVVGPGGR